MGAHSQNAALWTHLTRPEPHPLWMGGACVPWAWGHSDIIPTHQTILGWPQLPRPFLTVTLPGERPRAPSAVIQRNALTWPDKHTLSRRELAAHGLHSDTMQSCAVPSTLPQADLQSHQDAVEMTDTTLGQVISQIK